MQSFATTDGSRLAGRREEWSGRIYDGRWFEGSGGSLVVVEKATGAHLGVVGVASAADVAQCAQKARLAQLSWAATPGAGRAKIMRAVARLIEESAEELHGWAVRESGGTSQKVTGELTLGVVELEEAADLAAEDDDTVLRSSEDRPSFARRVPLGVVGAILPWNGPFLLALRALAPALALGNAVLLKPDPQTPITGGVMLAELFRRAGLPEGLLCVLPGGAETGEAIVASPAVNMVSFTGSTRAGRRVGELAGGLLKRVSLELGGNNAFIVLDDAEIPRAVDAAIFGSFFHAGQICMTAGRHLVHARVAAEYTELLVERTKQLVVGDPFTGNVDVGPMINLNQVRRGADMLAASLSAGAKLLVGGHHQGLFFEPTVLTDVTSDMPVFTEERFAPIAPITVVRNDDEAISLANHTDYGLVAAVHSADVERAMAVANQLRTGMAHINDQGILHETTAPMGGFGASGNGARYGSLTNLDEFTQWRWFTTREQAPAYSLHD